MAPDLSVLRRKRTVKRNNLEKKLFVQIDDIITEVFTKQIGVDAVVMQEGLSDTYNNIKRFGQTNRRFNLRTMMTYRMMWIKLLILV